MICFPLHSSIKSVGPMGTKHEPEQESIAAIVTKLYSVNPDRWNMSAREHASAMSEEARGLYTFGMIINKTKYEVYRRFGGIHTVNERVWAVFGSILSGSGSRPEY